MPNQRKKSKVHMGGFLEKDIMVAARELARLQGRNMTMTEIVKDAIMFRLVSANFSVKRNAMGH